ncbi:hypothetical protein PG991_015266 [Apiospora marii]|uniref:F-box domain-containing protein n=1 Tax=Apiospora marii TaxID=335849 RepID=A0ABR1R158_9PEZI
MRALQMQTAPAGLNTLPTEILKKIGDNLNLRDLTSLLKCCKHTQARLRGQYYVERQVRDEQEFDRQRLWHNSHLTQRNHIVNFTLTEVARWPESRAVKFTSQDEFPQRVFALLDEDVGKWGAGMLYFTFSTLDFLWDKSLVAQLPKYHRVGSLMNRAITSCHDEKVMKDIIKAYFRFYTVYLLGWKTNVVRRRFTGGYSMANDLPPVLWACCENRVDVLNLLTRNLEDTDIDFWQPMDVDLVVDGHNTTTYDGGPTTKWLRSPPHLIDAWECAFHPLDSHGRRKHLGDVNEDACLWLLDRNLGFSTRYGGLPIQHLAEAAVLKKTRVVEALLKYFKANLTAKKYQRAIVLALHAAARGWSGPHEPKPHRKHQHRLNAAAKIPDGHEEVMEILLEAGDEQALLKQNPGRKEDEGLLAGAVRTAPQNALYMLNKQIRLGVTDRRDLRAALFVALTLGGNGDTQRLDFFRTVLPQRLDLVCGTEELDSDGSSWNWDTLNLMNGLIAKMRDCFATRCFTTALYFVGWLGRECVGARMVQEMEALEARQVARRQRQVAGAPPVVMPASFTTSATIATANTDITTVANSDTNATDATAL